MEQYLSQPIKFLQGVGPQRAELLEKELGITTFHDLLYYFPYKYIDRSTIYQIRDIPNDSAAIQVRGVILSMETLGEGRNHRLNVMLSDGSDTASIVFFKGINYVKKSLKIGTEYIVFGKPSFFGGKYSFVHPDIEEVTKYDSSLRSPLMGMYNTSEKLKTKFLNTKAILKLQTAILTNLKGHIQETLPQYIIQKYHLMSLYEALFNIHLPQDAVALNKAQYRIKFEELLYTQLSILKRKTVRTSKLNGHIFQRVGETFNQFYHQQLPFQLTNAQKRVIKEIRKDTGMGYQMNRLLQGDVGSGKTLVALMCMLIAIDNGFQACLMCPTEILSQQHFQTIRRFLGDMNVEVELLTGNIKGKKRTTILERLKNNQIKILVGTHALIEEMVQFSNLGLVVIDEQHRFGVAQRAALWNKNTKPPHILVMTATPIPRTLAMTLYGDLDVSVIDELPAGRKPIKTIHLYDSQRLKMHAFVKQQIAAGRQIYMVFPLIEESDKLALKALTEGVNSILEAFPAPEYATSVVHGQMKAEEKDSEMKRFITGKTQILLATTVIEVGVDVPNATVMIIEDAERFGLSQLHQLRGRVGRGQDQSYCILMTPYKVSSDGRKRIEALLSTTEGFEISELDLKLRGPGELDGTRQSGQPFDLKLTNLAKDGLILQQARNIAEMILEEDKNLTLPQNEILRRELSRKGNVQDWSMIS